MRSWQHPWYVLSRRAAWLGGVRQVTLTAQLKPAKHCELAGVPLKCPADSASMLSAFYLQLKYAGSHNGQRDAAGAAEGSAHSYSLKMKDTAVRR